jgi:LmbE family N-acetylglucosaminyl deacetylase
LVTRIAPIDVQPTQKLAELFVPDGTPWDQACLRTTHAVIAAHADDVEFMAWNAILECYRQPGKGLGAVIVTDGRGSPRRGPYAKMTDEQMRAVRRKEQKQAAVLGEYAWLACLDFQSAAIKRGPTAPLHQDLCALIQASRPRVIYTHNLADRHDTHVAVALHAIAALRTLPAESRPERLWGCEVWGGLDWLEGADKHVFDVSARSDLTTALMRVFDSQIAGNKEYDQATAGRKRSNATYADYAQTDQASAAEFAMDLTPLIHDPKLDVQAYVAGMIERFRDGVAARIRRLGGGR